MTTLRLITDDTIAPAAVLMSEDDFNAQMAALGWDSPSFEDAGDVVETEAEAAEHGDAVLADFRAYQAAEFRRPASADLFTSATVEIHGESTETFRSLDAIDESTVDNAIDVYLATATVELSDGRTFELSGEPEGWCIDRNGLMGAVLSRSLSDAIQEVTDGFPDHPDLA